MLFYNARYYDPAIGRFISADSVISNPANPQTFNRYAYVTNNPLRYTDPTGHVQCDGGSACFTGGVGGVRGGGGGPGNPVKGLKQAIVALFVWAGSVIAGNAASKKPVEWPNYPRTKVADPLPKDKRLEDGATDFEKQVYGEKRVDDVLAGQGWEKVGGSEQKEGARGIDGVYRRQTADGEWEYLVGEAKYGTSDYGNTNDGRQMSGGWIDERLRDTVDDDILKDILDKGYTKKGYRVDQDGRVYEEDVSW